MAVSAAPSLLRPTSRWQTACAEWNPGDRLQKQVTTSIVTARERYCLRQHSTLNAAGWGQEGKQDASGGRKHLKSPFFHTDEHQAALHPARRVALLSLIAPERAKSPLSLPGQTFPWEHKLGQSHRPNCPSILSAGDILKQMPEDVHTQQVNHSFSSLPISGSWHPKEEVILQSTLSYMIFLAVLTHFERHCGCWEGSEPFPSREGSALLTHSPGTPVPRRDKVHYKLLHWHNSVFWSPSKPTEELWGLQKPEVNQWLRCLSPACLTIFFLPCNTCWFGLFCLL